MIELGFLRAWRVFCVAVLAVNVVALVVDAVTGDPVVVLPIVAVALFAVVIVLTTKGIGRRAEQMRPRPDYAAIARMEREVYGETFDHEGAPLSRPSC